MKLVMQETEFYKSATSFSIDKTFDFKTKILSLV